VKNTTPNTYGGISGVKLRSEVAGVSVTLKAGAKTTATTNDSYCLQSTSDLGKTYYHYEGGYQGVAQILTGACPVAYNVT
jgi:hypothetical protein